MSAGTEFELEMEDGSFPKELQCAICLNGFDCPLELVPCGHTFCKDCCNPITECPSCRKRIKKRKPANRIVISMADALKGTCSTCDWKGTRGEFRRHQCPNFAACPPPAPAQEEESHTDSDDSDSDRGVVVGLPGPRATVHVTIPSTLVTRVDADQPTTNDPYYAEDYSGSDYADFFGTPGPHLTAQPPQQPNAALRPRYGDRSLFALIQTETCSQSRRMAVDVPKKVSELLQKERDAAVKDPEATISILFPDQATNRYALEVAVLRQVDPAVTKVLLDELKFWAEQPEEGHAERAKKQMTWLQGHQEREKEAREEEEEEWARTTWEVDRRETKVLEKKQ